MHTMLKLSTTALAATLLATTAAFATGNAPGSPSNPAPAAAAVERVKDGETVFTNNAYITLSGTVGEITDGDEFMLIHPGGSLEVDTNDAWPDLFQQNSANLLKTGDHVSVTGRVDNNLFSQNEIEAYRLTVDGSGYSRVYTNDSYAPTGEGLLLGGYHDNPAGLKDDQKVRLTGVISRILDDEEFMLNYGNGEIRVDADDVDFTNTTRLTVGDEVTVYGEVSAGWFQKKELEADRIIMSRSYSQTMR